MMPFCGQLRFGFGVDQRVGLRLRRLFVIGVGGRAGEEAEGARGLVACSLCDVMKHLSEHTTSCVWGLKFLLVPPEDPFFAMTRRAAISFFAAEQRSPYTLNLANWTLQKYDIIITFSEIKSPDRSQTVRA